MKAPTARIPYSKELHPDGLDFFPDGTANPYEVQYQLIRECVELGHRLAMQGKDIVRVNVTVREDPCEFRKLYKVRAETKFRLAKKPAT